MSNSKQMIRSRVENGVMYVTFDNPEDKNGLNWIGFNQLCDCYQRVIDDKTFRLIVLSGNEQYFFTGGRVNAKNPGEQEKYTAALARHTALSSQLTVPKIAAINGDCLKGGMSVLAYCDFAIACDDIKFGFPEVRMGSAPMVVMANTMSLMPRKFALEAYCTSWDFTAQDALRIGMLNRVVPRENFWQEVQKYIDVILNTPRELIDMTLRAYYSMEKLDSRSERVALAMKMLKEDVLPSMEHRETQYNV